MTNLDSVLKSRDIILPTKSIQSKLWRRQWHPTPVPLPGKSHGQRSLVGCSPWGREVSDMTEKFHFHFSLSWIGEGNGNPLQCSCLENPRDGRAWWAAIYGVVHSRTRLKWLSSSSSSMVFPIVMYGYESWTIKKAEHQRTDAFELWCWRRLLKVPWTARRSNQSILKEISVEYSLDGLMLKLQYFGQLTWSTNSLEKTLMLGTIEGRRRRGQQRWDGWMASPTRRTWVWESSGSWWWTRKPGVLQSMELERVGHNWVTELNWTDSMEMNLSKFLEKVEDRRYDFPGGSDGKASAYNARDLGSIPRLRGSPGEGNGHSLLYSCLENPRDRGAW